MRKCLTVISEQVHTVVIIISVVCFSSIFLSDKRKSREHKTNEEPDRRSGYAQASASRALIRSALATSPPALLAGTTPRDRGRSHPSYLLLGTSHREVTGQQSKNGAPPIAPSTVLGPAQFVVISWRAPTPDAVRCLWLCRSGGNTWKSQVKCAPSADAMAAKMELAEVSVWLI